MLHKVAQRNIGRCGGALVTLSAAAPSPITGSYLLKPGGAKGTVVGTDPMWGFWGKAPSSTVLGQPHPHGIGEQCISQSWNTSQTFWFCCLEIEDTWQHSGEDCFRVTQDLLWDAKGKTKGGERNRSGLFGKENACENTEMKRTGHI